MNMILDLFRRAVAKFLPVLDVVLMPFTYIAALWFLALRRGGIDRANVSRKIFLKVGVFPIRDHYYEPVFNSAHIRLRTGERNLPGFKLNIEEQLGLLSLFDYRSELTALPFDKKAEGQYYYNNPSFFAGDAEFLYSMIRLKKPNRIIEIGSGFSTLMMLEAIKKNKAEDRNYDCKVTCVEPYEMPWLEKTGVEVIRKRVQELESSLFQTLQSGDFLFIDSSHVIRPDGDVLFEYLEILPVLRDGVIVHIHDIYTPFDYPREYFEKHIIFINEQYLVEAFLSLNDKFKIVAALNYLKHRHFERLVKCCPALEQQPHQEPRSLWIVKQ